MPEITVPMKQKARRTLVQYVCGFLLSLLLTLAAYYSVVHHVSAGNVAIAVIVGLAIAQLMTQLTFFLHLGQEGKPRLNLTVFVFMLMVIGIVVIGSLWIMHNLDYNMMPQEMEHRMLEQVNAGGI
jgi:cytochrome o ubiquinol oxidase operon protein cyoD